MKKTVFLLLISSALFSGCKYGSANLKCPIPPVVALPVHVHTIAVVNRSLSKTKSIIESVIYGEIGDLELASEQCLIGVYDGIYAWKHRFYWDNYIDSSVNIVISAKKRFYGVGTHETSQLLDWKTVKEICDSTKADALLVLETFDSNSDLLLNVVTKEINAVIKTGSAVMPTPPQQIKVNVVSYWRMYDPVKKNIIDQFQVTNGLTYKGQGSNFAIIPPNTIPQLAYTAGEQYIQRFLPGYFFVQRDFYKRGKGISKQKFKMAFRRSSVADWTGAKEIWSELVKDPNDTNAGRACFNMAVAYEALGQYDKAVMWARKSYVDYGNKRGKEYANQLKCYSINNSRLK